MAITQISKIQVRQGNYADLPTLNPGELGYATDTRQLFIGNVGGALPTDNTEIGSLAHLITFGTSPALVASGTVQGNATPITTTVNNVITVAVGTGVRLPIPTTNGGFMVIIRNGGANTLKIYPHIGGTIDGAATNTPLSVGTGSMTKIVAFDTNTWYTI